MDECSLITWFSACRYELERKKPGPRKSAKWIGLSLPIQIPERRGKSKRMMFAALVVGKDDF